MQTLINYIYLLSLVCWLGSVVFFSFVAAPAIFKTLDREKAGELVGVIFPRYYFIGYVCGVLALTALLAGSAEIPVVQSGLLLGMIICTFFAGMVIGPRARDLKARIKAEPDNSEALRIAFKSLHGWSVRLNAAVLLMGLVLLWGAAGILNLASGF